MRDKPDKYDCTHIETLMTYAKPTPPSKPMLGKTPGKRGC